MSEQWQNGEQHHQQILDLRFQSGLDLCLDTTQLELKFGPRIVHPAGERRTLDEVRQMLEDPRASGPEHLYTIYMDIFQEEDAVLLRDQGLLYGSVVYNHGVVGNERLRSQGHVHSEKEGTGLRYSEIYEFWTGRGYVYLQKECTRDVSRAFLVEVGPGDKLVIPFGWAHLVVTLGDEVLSFGAWCARANHLEYDPLRALGGPAHFVLRDGSVIKNPRYGHVADVQFAKPSDFPSLDVPAGRPMYTSWREHPDLFAFMANPEIVGDIWSSL